MNPMIKCLRGALAAVSLMALVLPAPAGAASITLGDQDFATGSVITLATFTAAQGGEPAPIGVLMGSDPGGTFFSAFWTFTFAPGAVGPASITFGILDTDSAAPGHQLASFSVDGVDLTAALDALFEAPGVGNQSQVDVFTLALSGGALAALADGSATFSLTLQGPSNAEFPGNGAGLDFSRLDYTAGGAVPEPATLALLGLGLAGLGFARRRKLN